MGIENWESRTNISQIYSDVFIVQNDILFIYNNLLDLLQNLGICLYIITYLKVNRVNSLLQ